MIKEVRIPDEDFIDLYEFLKQKIDSIEADKDKDITEMLEKIEKKYATRLDGFTKSLEKISKVEFIEVPDEEETEEDNYTTEQTEV